MWRILPNLADRVQPMRQTLPGLSFMNLISTWQTFPGSIRTPVGARVDFYQSATQRLIAATGVKQASTCERGLQDGLTAVSP